MMLGYIADLVSDGNSHVSSSGLFLQVGLGARPWYTSVSGGNKRFSRSTFAGGDYGCLSTSYRISASMCADDRATRMTSISHDARS